MEKKEIIKKRLTLFDKILIAAIILWIMQTLFVIAFIINLSHSLNSGELSPSMRLYADKISIENNDTHIEFCNLAFIYGDTNNKEFTIYKNEDCVK